MKIGIIGNYGATNVGDDAILTSILKSCEGDEVTVFSSNPDSLDVDENRHSAPLFPLGIRSCFKVGFKSSINALRKVDVVVLGGGGLFQDSYLYACFLWAWQIFWVKYFKKPLFIYATGVGPLKTRVGRMLTRWSYGYADQISVRDDYSYDLLEKIGLKENVTLTADPVFVLGSGEASHDSIKRETGLFVISVRPWLGYNQKIIDVLSAFLLSQKETRNARFIFACMQEIKEDDLRMIKPLIRKLGGEIHLSKDYSDLLTVMRQAEFAIGMRYHFMIAALMTSTPIIPISYAPKTTALFEKSRLKSHLIELKKLNSESLLKAFKELSVGYNNTIIYQSQLASQLRERAIGNRGLFNDFRKRFDQKPGE